MAHGVGHHFLVVHGGHGDHLFVHDLVDLLLIPGQQQLAQLYGADELAVFVDDIEGINGFLVHAGAANFRHGLAHGHAPVKFHIFDGHNGTGAVFRVAKELVNQPALLLVRALQKPAHHSRGQFLQQVHRVVHEHVVDDAHGLLVAQGIDQAGALIGIHVGKNVRGNILGQQPEDHNHPFVIQGGQVFGDVHLVEHTQRTPQFALFSAFHQGVQALFDGIEVHSLHSPFQKSRRRTEKTRRDAGSIRHSFRQAPGHSFFILANLEKNCSDQRARNASVAISRDRGTSSPDK